jgi:predicted methyltransferase
VVAIFCQEQDREEFIMAKRIASVVLLSLTAALTGACGGNGESTSAPQPAPVAPAAAPAEVPVPEKSLADVIAGDHRSADNRARDAYRHPQETLEFFGIRPDMSVIEIWPATGWYTEILGPYLRNKGRYIAAHWDPVAKQEFIRNGVKAYQEKLAGRPDLYDKVEMAVLAPPEQTGMVPAESVDMVVTFRNIHNWMASGQAETLFAAMYRVLKPGGVLGVVEHRALNDKPQDPKAKSGYVREDYAITLAEKAGFVMEAASEVNANPGDTKDYEGGVWTLPPTLRQGDKDKDKYLAVGESDRFTLRFRKPGSAAGVGEGAPPATDEASAEAGGETPAPPP